MFGKQAFRGRAGAGLRDEIARDVNAADHATAARSDEGEISRAAGHLEHARARLEGLPRHEFLGEVFDYARSVRNRPTPRSPFAGLSQLRGLEWLWIRDKRT